MRSTRHPFVLRSARNELLVDGDAFVLCGKEPQKPDSPTKRMCSACSWKEGKGPFEYTDEHENANREHGKAKSQHVLKNTGDFATQDEILGATSKVLGNPIYSTILCVNRHRVKLRKSAVRLNSS